MYKENILRVVLASVFVILFVSCADDFLDRGPSKSIDQNEVFTSATGVNSAINGMYRYLRSWQGEAANRHDQAGLGSCHLVWDVMGQDLIVAGNWYTYDYMVDYRLAHWAKTAFFWDLFYELINNSNNIIANIDNVEASDEQKGMFEAQAKVMRAFSYFNLARLYQQTYALNNQAPGLPIYTTPAHPKIEGAPRSSLQAVYDLIIEDLEFALANFGDFEREDKSQFDLNVAKGIFARVLVETGDYDRAIVMAQEAREGYPLMSQLAFASGFNNYANGEWIWGLPFNPDQGLTILSTFSFIDHSSPGKGYENIYVASDYIDLFTSPSDVRYQLLSMNPAPNPAGYEAFISNKFVDTAERTGHLVMMRSAEMYLIEAEALAHSDPSAAMDILHILQSARDVNAVKAVVANTAEALDEVWKERRRELLGEGFSLFDLKRFQKPLTRAGNHKEIVNLPANPVDFVYQIPQSEIDANINMTEEDQNP